MYVVPCTRYIVPCTRYMSCACTYKYNIQVCTMYIVPMYVVPCTRYIVHVLCLYKVVPVPCYIDVPSTLYDVRYVHRTYTYSMCTRVTLELRTDDSLTAALATDEDSTVACFLCVYIRAFVRCIVYDRGKGVFVGRRV